MTPQETALIIKISYAPWPHIEVRPELAMSFHEVIGEHELKDVREAVIEILSEGAREYPPKPGEILAEILRRKKNKEPVLKFSGPSLESYQREFSIAGKKTMFTYLKATKEVKAEYVRAAKELGRRYSEAIPAREEFRYEPDCPIPDSQMQMLFGKLQSLMGKYQAAEKNAQAIAICDRERDDLKDFYYAVVREVRERN